MQTVWNYTNYCRKNIIETSRSIWIGAYLKLADLDNCVRWHHCIHACSKSLLTLPVQYTCKHILSSDLKRNCCICTRSSQCAHYNWHVKARMQIQVTNLRIWSGYHDWVRESPVWPRWVTTRLEEHAVSVLIQGPWRPNVYDTRPTRKGSVLPVVLLAEDVEMPLSAST